MVVGVQGLILYHKFLIKSQISIATKICFDIFVASFPHFLRLSNIPLEHTQDPQPRVYEGIPFIWGFGDFMGYAKQGYVGVLLEHSLHQCSPMVDLLIINLGNEASSTIFRVSRSSTTWGSNPHDSFMYGCDIRKLHHYP